jgi:rsbT co-antagonist protein RsbR
LGAPPDTGAAADSATLPPPEKGLPTSPPTSGEIIRMASLTTALDRALANEQEVLAEWVQLQLSSSTLRSDLMKESELREQSREFIVLFRTALSSGIAFSATASDWGPVRDFLANASRSRALQGFSPSETATFVLSLKQPIFVRLRKQVGDDSGALADAIWAATVVLDRLALFTTEMFLKSREDVILSQQQELMELSTPVVELWTGILALPLIGTLDSARTQVVMESLLQAIVRTGAAIAIIDITGVPTVDTLVAQHLLKTVAAARLMGADCIISGIRPQIAQTIVHLGVDLSEVSTKATLADAFTLALRRTNTSVIGGKPTPATPA